MHPRARRHAHNHHTRARAEQRCGGNVRGQRLADAQQTRRRGAINRNAMTEKYSARWCGGAHGGHALVTPSLHSCREKLRQSSAGCRKPILSAIMRMTSCGKNKPRKTAQTRREWGGGAARRISRGTAPTPNAPRCVTPANAGARRAAATAARDHHCSDYCGHFGARGGPSGTLGRVNATEKRDYRTCTVVEGSISSVFMLLSSRCTSHTIFPLIILIAEPAAMAAGPVTAAAHAPCGTQAATPRSISVAPSGTARTARSRVGRHHASRMPQHVNHRSGAAARSTAQTQHRARHAKASHARRATLRGLGPEKLAPCSPFRRFHRRREVD
jgi:hypothetical protein